MYHAPADGGSTANQWAKWQAPSSSNPLGHFYEIFIHVPNDNATSWQAPYTIVYEGGAKTAAAVADQFGLFNQWVSIGTYRMTGSDYVYIADATQEAFGTHCGAGQWCLLGVDAVKFVRRGTAYLPDLKPTGGWSSTWTLRNNGGGPVQVVVSYFDSSGSYQCATVFIPPGAPSHSATSVTVPPPPGCASPIASAVVDADQDIEVIVVTDNSSDKVDAYEGIPATTSVSGLGTGTTVYVPVSFSNWYGWHTTLYVQNAGAAQTTVTAQLYNDSGGTVGSPQSAAVNPGGQASFSLGGASIGSARVSASQPLAVIVRHYATSNTDSMECAAAVAGSTTGRLTSLFKSYYGWTSSYQSQETTNHSVGLSVSYHPGGSTAFSLNPFGHREVWLGGEAVASRGSARAAVTSGTGQVVTAVHHGYTNPPGSAVGAIGYPGYAAGARDLYLPLLKKIAGDWDSSLTVHNVGPVATSGTVRFYNSAGGQVGWAAFALQPNQSVELYSQIPAGETSAWVHAGSAGVAAAAHIVKQAGAASGRSYGYAAVP